MIQRIIIEHFKCFESLALPMAPLTLLTGLNAAGKSTIIQALTLLKQTLHENPLGDALVC
jgi:predicted ATPase